MNSEFYDLAELALNYEAKDGNGAPMSAWGNLGYWDGARSYPQACQALADQLAQGLRLSHQDRVLDVGFGCGDQILHWRRAYGVQDIDGLNLSASQTALARQRLAQGAEAPLAARLRQGSVAQLLPWARRTGLSRPDVILALDCAYHFPSRRQFLADAAALMGPGGRLGVSDLVLARHPLPPWKAGPLRVATRLSRIPWHNLCDAEDYRRQWGQAGFRVEHFVDITEQVLSPFGAWLRRYRAALDPAVAQAVNWRKFQATAAFLRWAQSRHVLRYIVCCGVREAS